MSKSISIKCDNCNCELIVDTFYPANYILELKAINVNQNTTGPVYTVQVCPPINSIKYFCGKQCLASWLESEGY